MPLDSALREMMTRQIVVRPIVDRDAGGSITLGAPVTMRAYVDGVLSMHRAGGGVPGTQQAHRPSVWVEQEITLDSVIFFDPTRTEDVADGKFPDEVRQFDDADTGGPSHWQAVL